MKEWCSTVAGFRQALSTFFRCEVFERRNCRACRQAVYFEPSAERHDAGDGTFACERYKLGAASPGPVTDEEYLNLIISDPQSLDPRSGYVLPLLVKQVNASGT